MPFKLRVLSEEKGAEVAAYDRLFYLPEVHMGSASANELVLVDKGRTVSRRHARIFREGSEYVVEDSQSRNGTFLNDKQLAPEQAVTLKEGDRIQIGPFVLAFQFIPEESRQSSAVSPAETPTLTLVDAPRLAEDLAAQLRQTFHEYESEESPEKQKAIEESLRRFLDKQELDSRSRREVLSLARKKFPDRSYELVRLQEKSARLEAERVVGKVGRDVQQAAFEALQSLATKFIPESGQLPSTEDVQVFAECLRGALEVFLATSYDLLQGRGEWKREFDLEQSLQIRASHPVKTAKSPADIAKYLFSPRTDEPVSTRVELLSDALQGLMFHQLAILAGYEESIRYGIKWILDELAPENFGAGSRKLLGGGKGQWERYVERHRELSKEDVKRIQSRFLTGFNRGYEQKLDELKKISTKK
jgi:type VI secretion system FHA domain protein